MRIVLLSELEYLLVKETLDQVQKLHKKKNNGQDSDIIIQLRKVLDNAEEQADQ